MQILLADDHQLFREGVCLMISEMDAEVEVLEAETFPVVLSTLAEHPSISLLLMDLSMPGGEWRQVVQEVRAEYPDLRIVILSATDDQSSICEAIKIGVHGFVPKTSSGKVMQNVIRLVLDGGTYLPPVLLSRDEDGIGLTASIVGKNFGPATSAFDITPRQKDVLDQLRSGLSNKEIARNLDLSEGTVKLHVTALLRALDVNNRTQAVIKAQKAGMIIESGQLGGAR